MRTQSHNIWLGSMTTQELQDRLEMYGWDRAEVEENKQAWADIYESASDYFDFMLTTIGNELHRRKRLRDKYGINRGLAPTPMGRQRFEAIKRAVPIPLLLWEHGCGEPAPAGTRQIMSCPLGLHHDSTPSFTIYPGDQGWYCFGCNQGGSVIDLAMLLKQSNDPREALAYLESIAQEHQQRATTAHQAMASVAARI